MRSSIRAHFLSQTHISPRHEFVEWQCAVQEILVDKVHAVLCAHMHTDLLLPAFCSEIFSAPETYALLKKETRTSSGTD